MQSCFAGMWTIQRVQKQRSVEMRPYGLGNLSVAAFLLYPPAVVVVVVAAAAAAAAPNGLGSAGSVAAVVAVELMHYENSIFQLYAQTFYNAYTESFDILKSNDFAGHTFHTEPLHLALSFYLCLSESPDGFSLSTAHCWEDSTGCLVDDIDRGRETCDRFDGPENVLADLANCDD